MNLFICYPKCTTCIKAQKYLDDKNVVYDCQNIKLNNPSYQDIKNYHEKSGLDIKRFFNTSGLKYKELGLKDRLPNLSLDEKYHLLASDGMLIKRPIMIKDDIVLLGFNQKQWNEVF